MRNILSWKFALATVGLSGVAMSASASQVHPVTMPTLAVNSGVTAVRIIARAGRRDLKLQQQKRVRNKERTRNKEKGAYPAKPS
jgi:hypothetical protein